MATRKTIELDPDFREFIALLNSNEVKYLLIGGYAVNYYGYHRFTADIDFWIATDLANAEKVTAALTEFGFGQEGLRPELFTVPDKVHMFGRKPVRIDLLTGPSGVDFDECYARRQTVMLEGLPVPLISLDDLRRNKQATARDKDLMDLKKLAKRPR